MKTRIVNVCLALVLLSAFFFVFHSPAMAEHALSEVKNFPMVEIRGIISQKSAADISRQIDALEKSAPQGVILYIDSEGGQVAGLLDLAERIERITVPTYGLVEKGLGGAVVLVASVDEIFLTPDGMVGNGAAGILSSSGKPPSETTRKVLKIWEEWVVTFARSNSHDPDIFLCMVNPDKELTRDERVWCTIGEVLVLNAEEALQLSISHGTVTSARELVEQKYGSEQSSNSKHD